MYSLPVQPDIGLKSELFDKTLDVLKAEGHQIIRELSVYKWFGSKKRAKSEPKQCIFRLAFYPFIDKTLFREQTKRMVNGFLDLQIIY